MKLGVVWILALAAFTAFAQSPSGTRLYIGNAAGGGLGRLAPGSVGQYSINFDTIPPSIFGVTPTLTLLQPGQEDRRLDTLDSSVLSGRFYLPPDAAIGPGSIRLEGEGVRVTADVEIVSTAPALYGLDFTRVLSVQRAPSFEAVLLTRPIRPGQTLIVWGTGLGLATQADVHATLGGQPLQVQYAGPAPGQRGLDQYNLTVPAGSTLDGSCYSRLELKVRDASASGGFIATSNTDGPCRHPLTLTDAQLTTLDKGGAVPVAQFSLSSEAGGIPMLLGMDFSALERHEGANAVISSLPALSVALSSAYAALPSPATTGCMFNSGGTSVGLIGGWQTPTDVPPSLGDKVRLAGPTQSYDLTKPADTPWFDSMGYYLEMPVGGPVPYLEQLPASAFTPGKWTVSGDGDKSLEPFRIDTDIPGPVRFLNPEALRIVNSTRDFTLRWQTEWMRPTDTLNISLIAQRYPQQPDVIACTASALDGTLTIDAALVKQLRPVADQLTLLSVGYSRSPEVTSLRRRDADPVPAILNWSSFTTIPVTVR